MIRRFGLLFSTLLVLFAVAACGGNGTPGASPTSPSPAVTQPPATTGATISGSVSGLGGTSGAGLVGARDVTTVTATVGSFTLTVTIDSQGNFVISGLPGGTITLTFSGTAAHITLQNVGENDKIRLRLTIANGTATIEAEQRELMNGLLQLEGRISGFAPVGAAAEARTGFYVGETLVTLATGAQMRHGDTPVLLSQLKVGDRIHAEGTAGTPDTYSTAAIVASTVIVQNTNANVPVNIKGNVASVAGGCPTPGFVVSGWTVVTAQSTSFKKGTCADVVAGAGVHVKGDVQADGTVLATWVQFGN